MLGFRLLLTSVRPYNSLFCLAILFSTNLARASSIPPLQLSFFCQRNTLVMKSPEEAEGGKDWRRNRVLFHVSNSLCVFSALRKRMVLTVETEKRIWVQSFSSGNQEGLEWTQKCSSVKQQTVACPLCVQSCNTAVAFSKFFLFSLFKNRSPCGFSCPSDLSLKVSDNGNSYLDFGAVKTKIMLSSFTFILLFVMRFLDFWYKLFTSDSCYLRISGPCSFSCSSCQIPLKKPSF